MCDISFKFFSESDTLLFVPFGSGRKMAAPMQGDMLSSKNVQYEAHFKQRKNSNYDYVSQTCRIYLATFI